MKYKQSRVQAKRLSVISSIRPRDTQYCNNQWRRTVLVCACVYTACHLHLDPDETWKRELMNWCNAYTAYTREYNQWLCIKVTRGKYLLHNYIQTLYYVAVPGGGAD